MPQTLFFHAFEIASFGFEQRQLTAQDNGCACDVVLRRADNALTLTPNPVTLTLIQVCVDVDLHHQRERGRLPLHPAHRLS